jgi:hypothetical protein
MPADPELTQAVQGFLSQMWQHIDATIRAAIHQHHKEHEPGGKDLLRLPLFALADVSAEDPDNGDTLIYDDTTKLWGTGPGGSGSGAHQAHLGLILPASVVPPGPTNITGAAYTVTAVHITSDGDVFGSVGGCGSYPFGFGASGGTQDYGSNPNAPLNASWGNGSTITIDNLTYGSAASASYLTVDIALEG